MNGAVVGLIALALFALWIKVSAKWGLR